MASLASTIKGSRSSSSDPDDHVLVCLFGLVTLNPNMTVRKATSETARTAVASRVASPSASA